MPTGNRLHKVSGKTVVKTYRLLPYSEIVEILKTDGTAFFEDSKDQPLRRGTMWKASRRLSDTLGEKVVAQRGVLKLNDQQGVEGYLFSVVNQQSPRQKDKRGV